MKISFFLISVSIFAAGQALPAQAQETSAQEGMSRWQYKPNVWGAGKKSKSVPRAVLPHNVAPGAMPHSSTFMGVDPSIFKKPTPVAPPVAQQQTQIAISVPHTQAAPFRNDFGGPVVEHKAQPQAMTESPMPAAKSMSPTRIASSNNVSAHLRPFSHPSSARANAASLPQVQTYGGQGYTPGAVGAGTGAGQHVDTSLNGRIISRH